MIDELVKAANAMQGAGISAKDWHPKLKPLPKVTAKAPCIRIWLTVDGHIYNLEPLSPEVAAQLRKFEPDNGKSLPGFNVRPLYRLVKADSDIKQASKGKAGENLKAEWTKKFLEVCADERANNDFWEKSRDGLKQCFGRVREDLEKSCSAHLTKGETLQKFFEIIEKIDVEQFQKEYSAKLQSQILKGTLPATMMCYFVTAAKKQKEDSDSREPVPKFSVFLDIKDYKEYPIAHVKTIERLNALMSGGETEDTSTLENNNIDAYGLDNAALDEKFPEVLLPVLGGVKLRSQVKEVPAQSRYAFCEAKTFHVGAESRKQTKRALEWLADREREGETYGIAGDKELLFAYPRILPDKKIPLAKLLGAQKDDAYQKEDSFERLAASVIEQLKGTGKKTANAELEIFSLRKMDAARTKVVYYRNVTVASLEQASAAWYAGCQNIPPLEVWDWSKDKNEKTGKSYPVHVEGKTIFPIKLYRFLNAVWKHDGQRADTGKSKVRTFTPTDGLRLLLDKPNDALAVHMLSHFTQHAQGYFLTLCRKTGKHEITALPDKEYCPGIFGLLLFNLGNKKEDFMKESAFLLGRCLRVSDEIHRLYCEVVRKKELPPELCGSALLVSMMESPSTTLDQLAMRSAPYVKWARAFRDDEKGGLVHYWMNHWSLIADQLHALEWPKRLTPEGRAQVFLGYLASFPKNEGSTNADQTSSEHTTKQGEK